MIPVEGGYSSGSLKCHGEKGCLHNNLGLQEAVFFFLLFYPFHLDRLPFHCVLMFEPHLSLKAKYILANGCGINTGKSSKGNGLHFG
jgi:hypothetical protein